MKFVHILQIVLWVLIFLNFGSIFINMNTFRRNKQRMEDRDFVMNIDLSQFYSGTVMSRSVRHKHKRRASRNHYNNIIESRHNKPTKKVHKSPISRDGCYEYDDGYQYVNNGESDYIFIDQCV